MTQRLDERANVERSCDTRRGTRGRAPQNDAMDLMLSSPRLRRFTEIWVEERRRQLGLGEALR